MISTTGRQVSVTLGAVTLAALAYYYFNKQSKDDTIDENIDDEESGVTIADRLPPIDVTDPLYKWLEKIPKIELHAHLSGSIRTSTLLEFMNANKNNFTKKEFKVAQMGQRKTVKDVWTFFNIVHKAIQNEDDLYRITVEMIEDYAADNCKYLEIRTTPRAFSGSTLDNYVDTVIQAVKDCEVRKDLSIRTNILLSINRSKSTQLAWATLDLITRHKKHGVVGLDFSGAPGTPWIEFYDIFREAKERSIRTTLHTGEWLDDEETTHILDYLPDRVGHYCVVSDTHFQELIDKRIPVEICATSNLTTAVPSLDEHRFGQYPKGYPLTICVDDAGVFNVTLTSELYIIMKTFNLTREDVQNMMLQSCHATFQKPKYVTRLTKTIKKGFEKIEKMESAAEACKDE